MSVTQTNIHRYLCYFSYIGTKFSGLQRTTNRLFLSNGCMNEDNSIQYFIELALQNQLKPLHYPRLGLSSRTDSGVHALCNAFHVDLQHPLNNTYQPNRITRLVNEYFIQKRFEIKILNTHLVSKLFNSRKNAKWRSYTYKLAVLNNERLRDYEQFEHLLPLSELFRCHIIRKPNFIEMENAMNLFVGHHNFLTFSTKDIRSPQRDPVKTLDIFSMKKVYDLNLNEGISNAPISMWEFHIQSKSFLYNQIRRMMGCLIGVGLGTITVDKVKWMLENPSYLNWDPKIIMAPPYGLWLSNVFYDVNDFVEQHQNLSDHTINEVNCDHYSEHSRSEIMTNS